MSSDRHDKLTHALSTCNSPGDRFLAVVKGALAEGDANAICSAYIQAVQAAVAAEPPPFCTNDYQSIYHSSASDARWLAISIISNSQREGQGATDLWSLAACAKDPHEQQLVKQHAIDESRHSELYLILLDLTFPEMVEEGFRKELKVLSPGFSMRQELRPSPNQMNGFLARWERVCT